MKKLTKKELEKLKKIKQKKVDDKELIKKQTWNYLMKASSAQKKNCMNFW